MDDDNGSAAAGVGESVCADGGALTWRRVSSYCITSGEFNICKIFVGGEPRYELWDLTVKPHRFISVHGSEEDAKRAASEQNSFQPLRSRRNHT